MLLTDKLVSVVMKHHEKEVSNRFLSLCLFLSVCFIYWCNGGHLGATAVVPVAPLVTFLLYNLSGVPGCGYGDMDTGHHQVLVATLTLFQPEGADCAHQILMSPPSFECHRSILYILGYLLLGNHFK